MAGSEVSQVVDSLKDVIGQITARLRALETADPIAGSVDVVLFVDLPAAGLAGRVLFVSDGRKVGEGAGAGTGVLAVDDGVDWISPATDTPVTA